MTVRLRISIGRFGDANDRPSVFRVEHRTGSGLLPRTEAKRAADWCMVWTNTTGLVPRAGLLHPLALRRLTLPSPLPGRRNPLTVLVLLG